MAQRMPRLESKNSGTYSLFIKGIECFFRCLQNFCLFQSWPRRLTQGELGGLLLESLGHLTHAGANMQTIH